MLTERPRNYGIHDRRNPLPTKAQTKTNELKKAQVKYETPTLICPHFYETDVAIPWIRRNIVGLLNGVGGTLLIPYMFTGEEAKEFYQSSTPLSDHLYVQIDHRATPIFYVRRTIDGALKTGYTSPGIAESEWTWTPSHFSQQLKAEFVDDHTDGNVMVRINVPAAWQWNDYSQIGYIPYTPLMYGPHQIHPVITRQGIVQNISATEIEERRRCTSLEELQALVIDYELAQHV
jgi:hypothetical protein